MIIAWKISGQSGSLIVRQCHLQRGVLYYDAVDECHDLMEIDTNSKCALVNIQVYGDEYRTLYDTAWKQVEFQNPLYIRINQQR